MEVSLAKGVFFYGYAILQVPGGRLAEMFGSKSVLAASMAASTVFTLASPAAANLSSWAFIALRFLLGSA